MLRPDKPPPVETPSLKPSPTAQSEGEEDAYDPSRDCKIRLGPITNDEDCERYARILQPAYDRAHWAWYVLRSPLGQIPSVERICETIKILLGHVAHVEEDGPEASATGGLLVQWEGDHPVLYAHTDLDPSQVALTG